MDESSKLPDGLLIPDHQLLRRIGKGGYGEIWLARTVMGTFRAVKIVFQSNFDDIKPYTREFKGIEKFEPLSRSHPGLVNVLQIGLNNDAGCFYYVMELADDEVEGRYFEPDSYSAKTLSKELAARGRLPAGESLQICIGLASALSHLHEAGLVHRDIKPSNIIFVNGRPKLADIGLVIPLADARTFVGTEGYIPPEGPGTIQADIYSLGKVLYEISTGQNRDSFPELPSELSGFADRETIVEINEIVVKACANSPQARYRSAGELQADLEMLSEGRSIKRVRFVERQLARATRIAAAALIFAAAAGVFAYAVNRVRNREKQLLASQYVASGAARLEQRNLHGALPMFAEALRLQHNDESAAQAHRVRVGSALDQSPRLLQFWEQEHNVTDLHFSSDGARMLASGNKTARILDVSTGATNREFVVDYNIETAAFSPDDRRVLIANDRHITMFDAVSGAEVFERKQHGHLYSAEFSPDGKTLILACAKGCAHLIDANTGEGEEKLTAHRAEVSHASFSPDGSMIVTASYDGTARIWDAKALSLIASLPQSQRVYDAAFSPDNQRVVTASSDHTLQLWAIGPHPQLLARMEHHGTVRRARFSPDGRWIVSAGWDHTVRFWNGHNGQPVNSLINLQMPAMHATFSPEGRRVAISSKSGKVGLWDVQPAVPFNPGTGVVSANGERYVTFTSNTFRIWNARDDSPATSPIKISRPIASMFNSADGRTVAALCKGDRDIGDLAEVYALGTLMPRSFALSRVVKGGALSPDGSKLMTISSGIVCVWNTATGELLFDPKNYERSVTEAAFSPDSRVIIFASGTNVYILNAQTGVEQSSFSPAMSVRAISFSHDSSKFIVAGARSGLNPGAAFLCETRTGKVLADVAPHTDGISAACLTGDGKLAVSGGQDSFVAVWNAGTGQLRYERLPLSWQITSVAFSPDDRWILATSWYEMKLWETRTGHALTPVFSAPGVFDASGFCAGNARVWSRTSRGSLFFWNLPRHEASHEEITALAEHLGVTIPTGFHSKPSAFPISQLRQLCATNVSHTQATLESWHRQQAEFFESEKDLFAAGFHRAQLQGRIDKTQTNTSPKSSRP
jgi:WD40 repeat protein